MSPDIKKAKRIKFYRFLAAAQDVILLIAAIAIVALLVTVFEDALLPVWRVFIFTSAVLVFSAICITCHILVQRETNNLLNCDCDIATYSLLMKPAKEPYDRIPLQKINLQILVDFFTGRFEQIVSAMMLPNVLKMAAGFPIQYMLLAFSAYYSGHSEMLPQIRSMYNRSLTRYRRPKQIAELAKISAMLDALQALADGNNAACLGFLEGYSYRKNQTAILLLVNAMRAAACRKLGQQDLAQKYTCAVAEKGNTYFTIKAQEVLMILPRA